MPVVGVGFGTAVTVAGVTAFHASSVLVATTIAVAANLAIGVALSFATSQALGRPKAPSVSSLGAGGRERSVMVREDAC
jgi:hypothetical protein